MSTASDQSYTVPAIGGRYVDDQGRQLNVTELQPGDPLGREVIGLISHTPLNGHTPQAYATSARIFAAIWREP